MKTQTISKSKNMLIEDKQTRIVLSLVGILVAVIGSLTLLYGNHTMSILGFTPHLSESSLLSANLPTKVTAMNVVTAIWPF